MNLFFLIISGESYLFLASFLEELLTVFKFSSIFSKVTSFSYLYLLLLFFGEAIYFIFRGVSP
jgi:hypothetical protein